jgi:hypothetical protein
MTDNPKLALTHRITRFLHEIGLKTARAEIIHKTFLPGIDVDRGTILLAESRLLYPGDLLHEAGHLAVFSLDVPVPAPRKHRHR